jgi:ribonuclease D
MTIYLHQNDLPNDITFSNSVAVDSETMGLKIARDRLCLIQLSDGNGDAHLVHFVDKNYRAPNLKNLLNNEEVEKIFHFARFDIAAIKYYLGISINNIFCTKIASKLVRTYTDAHGLKSICEELLKVEISKKQQSSDWGNKVISQKQLEYAANDVLYLHQIKEKLQEMLIRENRQDIFKDCIKFLPTRVTMDLCGFGKLDIFSH